MRTMLPTANSSTMMASLLACLLVTSSALAQSFPLDSTAHLQPRGVEIRAVNYRGRKALEVLSSPASDSAWAAHPSGTGGGIVILPGVSFHNGTIDVDVSGQVGEGAPADARGFVGIGFRLAPDAAKYEYVYIRPTNGRADDQLRRNHSVQYSSAPDYEWLRLRTESPGKYETYVDLVPGQWTHLKIEVSEVKMRLYVNRVSQPTLIVNDLKLGDTTGGVALWIGVGTEAHFANLQISQ